ncbi:MAG TPA: hypothetical protein VMA75_03960 [Candidatus Paceibacterota bacterium]|nr:hypothetical protein [Candidatus Paceibacterota bacterium]
MNAEVMNDVRGVEQLGSTLSESNRELIASAKRLVDRILKAIPDDIPSMDLGANCSIDRGTLLTLYLNVGYRIGQRDYKVPVGTASIIDLDTARAIADAMEAGLAKRIREKLQAHLKRQESRLTALEDAEELISPV